MLLGWWKALTHICRLTYNAFVDSIPEHVLSIVHVDTHEQIVHHLLPFLSRCKYHVIHERGKYFYAIAIWNKTYKRYDHLFIQSYLLHSSDYTVQGLLRIIGNSWKSYVHYIEIEGEPTSKELDKYLTSFAVPNNATAVSVVLLNRYLNYCKSNGILNRLMCQIDLKSANANDACNVEVIVIDSTSHVVKRTNSQFITILSKCDELD